MEVIGKRDTLNCKVFLLRSVSAFILTSLVGHVAQGQPSVTVLPTQPDVSIESAWLGTGVDVSNVTWSGDSAQFGYITGFDSGFEIDDFPLWEGVIFGSGPVLYMGLGFNGEACVETGLTSSLSMWPLPIAQDLLDVSNEVSISNGNGVVVTSMNDVAVMEFDFVATGDSMAFDFIFSSEEYLYGSNSPTTPYNDAFAAFISGPGIEGPFEDEAVNLAVVPESSPPLPICVNSLNQVVNSHLYLESSNGYPVCPPGYSSLLSSGTSLQCGETYHLKLAIADANDTALPSYVIFKSASFQSSSVSISWPNALPSNQLEASPTFFEACHTAELMVSRSPNADLDATQTVHVEFSGSAEEGVDFTGIPMDITLEPGEESELVPFEVVNDGVTEGTEWVSLLLSTTSSCGDSVFSEVIFFIQDEPSPVVVEGDSLVICLGDSAELTPVMTGGTGLYDVSWSCMNQEEGGLSFAFFAETPGEFVCTAVVGDTCSSATASADFEILVPESIPLEVEIEGGDVVFDDEELFEVLAVVNGGTPPYSFVWEAGNYGPVNFPQALWYLYAQYNATSATVTVTDACGLSASATINVDYDVLTVDIPQGDVVFECEPTVDVTADISWGEPPYSIIWTNQQGVVVGGGSAVFTASDSAGITGLTVTVTDAAGAEASTSIAVMDNTEPLSVLLDPSYTAPCGDIIEVSPLISGGLPPFTTLWTEDGLLMSADPLLSASLSAPTAVVLSVTDDCGSEVETTVALEPLLADIDVLDAGQLIDGTVRLCLGDIAVFQLFLASGCGVEEADSWIWSFGDGNTLQTTNTFAPYLYAAEGCFEVQVTALDESGTVLGNSDVLTAIVSGPVSFEGWEFSHPASVCAGMEVNFQATEPSPDEYLVQGDGVFLVDNPGVPTSSSLSVEAGADVLGPEACGLSLTANIEHSFIGDLTIWLECPNGQQVLLLENGPSGGADDCLYPDLGNYDLGEPVIGENTPGIGYDYTWANSGEYIMDDPDNPALESLSFVPPGVYQPCGDFCDLAGCPVSGEWTLHFLDQWGADDGSLGWWTLTGLNLSQCIDPDAGLEFSWAFEDQTFSGMEGAFTLPSAGMAEVNFTLVNTGGCEGDTALVVEVTDPSEFMVTAGEDFTVCSAPVVLPGSQAVNEDSACSADAGLVSVCYGDNAFDTYTYCPDEPGDGTMMSILFSEGAIESCCDLIQVFDGSDTSAPLLMTLAGEYPQTSVVATNASGCLTVLIVSDGSVSCGGLYNWGFEDIQWCVGCSGGECSVAWNWEPSESLLNPFASSPQLEGWNGEAQTFVATAEILALPNCTVTDSVVVTPGVPGFSLEAWTGVSCSIDSAGIWWVLNYDHPNPIPDFLVEVNGIEVLVNLGDTAFYPTIVEEEYSLQVIAPGLDSCLAVQQALILTLPPCLEFGCTDPAACNHQPSAEFDNETCQYADSPCETCAADGTGQVVSADSDGDGICDQDELPGCMDVAACNFEASATDDDGSCEYASCVGCTDAEACNFDPEATVDDGGCEFSSCLGCTDGDACNFDAAATQDDGSCLVPSAPCEYCTENGTIALDTDGVCTGLEVDVVMDTVLYDGFGAVPAGFRRYHLYAVLPAPGYLMNGPVADDAVNPSIPPFGFNAGCGCYDHVSPFVPGGINNGSTINGILVGLDPELGYDSWWTSHVSESTPGVNVIETQSTFAQDFNVCSDQVTQGGILVTQADPVHNSVTDGRALIGQITTCESFSFQVCVAMQPGVGEQVEVYCTDGEVVVEDLCLPIHEAELLVQDNGVEVMGNLPASARVQLTLSDWPDVALEEQYGQGLFNDLPSGDFTVATLDTSRTQAWSSNTCRNLFSFTIENDGNGGPEAVLGCTVALASNYDPLATVDDGSCILPGCTDPSALNYNPYATVLDGSCIDACGSCPGDLNGDGLISVADLVMFLQNFGSPCQALDECGVPNGPGAVYACGCYDLEPGTCDCEGSVLDALGVCGGDCVSDADGDGICDDLFGCAPVSLDGYAYDVVEIGDECWFAENLRTTVYSDGSPVTLYEDWSQDWDDPFCIVYGEGGFDCNGDCDPVENLVNYGRLYSQRILDGSQNVCPSGWHVSTKDDWVALQLAIGGDDWGGVSFTAGEVQLLRDDTNSGTCPNSGSLGFNARAGGVFGAWPGGNGENGICCANGFSYSNGDLNEFGYFGVPALPFPQFFAPIWIGCDWGGEEGIGNNNAYSVRCVKD